MIVCYVVVKIEVLMVFSRLLCYELENVVDFGWTDGLFEVRDYDVVGHAFECAFEVYGKTVVDCCCSGL